MDVGIGNCTRNRDQNDNLMAFKSGNMEKSTISSPSNSGPDRFGLQFDQDANNRDKHLERKKYQYGAILFLLILHIVGFTGLQLPEWKGLMQALTPINLMISAIV